MASPRRGRSILLVLTCLLLSASVAACSPFPAATSSTSAEDQANARPAGWTSATHGDEAEPNYDVVFPENKVNQITITISPEHWAAMQADMTEILGEPGSRGGPGGRGGFAPPAGDQPPAGGGGGGGRGMNIANPMWVPGTIAFEGQTWTDVGVRYKGNSSLMSSWNAASGKLPFKLDFDQFEADHPAIKNQRFYGFKQLSLSNNWNDPSLMRETVTYDLLENAGLVAANTAFYEVSIDHGAGVESLGIYTMIEVIDDTVVQRAFEDDSGNIYEADGQGASLAAGTREQIEASFQKENNQDEADWSDIEKLYDVLHSDQRNADPAAWRASLEAVFDVDSFLKWLGLSAVLQHWDTYGGMTHNFYLYHDPQSGKLTWISWDHNLVLGASAGPGGRNAGQDGGGRGFGRFGSTSLDKKDVEDDWPLIRFLLDDPVYYARYVGFMKTTTGDVFKAEALATKYQQLSRLLAPYAAKDGGAEAFATAVQELTTKTGERSTAAAEFLATQAQ